MILSKSLRKIGGLGLDIGLILGPILMILLTYAVMAWADAPAVPAGSQVADAAASAASSSGQAAAAGQPGQPGLMGMLFPFLMMFGVIYFLMIRPQQKKFKEQQAMLTQLKHGDEVVTSAGLLGTIRGITDKVVTLELDEDVRVKVLKSTVAQVLKGQQVKDLA